MWQKKHKEIKAEWKTVDEKSVLRTLSSNFHYPKQTMKDMVDMPGLVVKTTFSLFRYIEDDEEDEKNKIINKIEELGYGCPQIFYDLTADKLQGMYDELKESNINLEVSSDLIKLKNIVEKYTEE